MIEEIEQWLRQGGTADYVTFSGSGEPTLNSELGDMIMATKKLTDIPVAVITNGSLLGEPEIRQAVLAADVLLPSLDAGIEHTFWTVNRPVPGVSFVGMTDGLVRTAQEYSGQLWLEIMLVEGVNDSEAELFAMREVVRRICPDKLQVNTVDRPSQSGNAKRVPDETLKRACEILGTKTEVITSSIVVQADERQWQQIEDELIKLLARRPCTLRDLIAASGRNAHEVLKHIRRLMAKGLVEKIGDANPYYRCVNGG